LTQPDFGNPRSAELLIVLLKFAIHRFQPSELLSEPSTTKLPCERVLFRLGADLHRDGVRQDANERREQSWRAFRNAVLNQPRPLVFLVSRPELSKKLGECLSSLDLSVSSWTLRTLPSLALPITSVATVAEHQNLIDLWTKLADPLVLIPGKIRSAFKARMNKQTPSLLRRATFDFMISFGTP
jgi:hypothetical protein